MDQRLILAAAALVLFANSASGQTLYKCLAGGKTTYSDRPCEAGTQRTVSPDGAPTAEERAAARARLAQDMASQSAKDADHAARLASEAQGLAAQQRMAAPQPIPDPRDNERVMVHSSRGWDYKTRGQIEAERAARAGRPANAAGAAWEQDRVTTYGPGGWESGTRLDAAKAEGARQRRRDESTVIVNGTPWMRSGRNGAINPQTGKYCSIVGGSAFCN